MTQAEATALLRAAGVMKPFRPHIEPETGAVLLRTRRAAQIIEGRLSGSEIVLSGSDFKAWTSQKRKAKTLANRHGLKVRLLDSEAELTVPARLADELLPLLGAKVARTVTPEVAERSRAVLQSLREAANASNLEPRPAQEGTSGDVPARIEPEQRPASNQPAGRATRFNQDSDAL